MAAAQHCSQFFPPLSPCALTTSSTSDQMNAKEKSRPVRQRGRVVALLRQAAYAIAVSLAATMSAAAADWPLEPAPYPATYPFFSPPPISQWESEIGGRYWYSVGRTEKMSSASPVARPFFSLGSPTQICRHIPVKLSVGWNTCLASSSRDLPAAAPSPAGISRTKIFRHDISLFQHQ